MSRANLSIIGLYTARPDLLDDMHLPSQIDREQVEDAILLECAELEMVYTNPDFMKRAIKSWSHHRVGAWEKMYETTQYEYDPLWNKDATITDTETVERKQSIDGTTSGSTTSDTSGTTSGTNSQTKSRTSTGSRTGSQTHEVTGFNDNTLAVDSKDSTTASDQLTDSGTDSGTDSSTTSEEREDSHSETRSEDLGETVTRTHTHRETGNIGVTSTMQLIKEQRDIVDFDVVQKIADEFKHKFCILVY